MREPAYEREARESDAREIATLTESETAADTTVLRAVPDLRGLRVEDASGIPVGELYGALAEAESGLLRYLDLALESTDRHVLVPIGHARVQDADREPSIRLRAALLEQLERVPPFPADVAHIDDPFERALLEAYGRTFHGERYYAHPAFDHDGIFAGEHPIIGDGGADMDEVMLQRLSYLAGWRVAAGEHDIRGWPLVLRESDRRLRITDLVIDTAAERVRYVVVEMPGGGARLVPIGFLHIDADANVVRTDALTLDDVAELPAYGGGGVTREYEERVQAALRRLLSGSRRYLLPDYRHRV